MPEPVGLLKRYNRAVLDCSHGVPCAFTVRTVGQGRHLQEPEIHVRAGETHATPHDAARRKSLQVWGVESVGRWSKCRPRMSVGCATMAMQCQPYLLVVAGLSCWLLILTTTQLRNSSSIILNTRYVSGRYLQA